MAKQKFYIKERHNPQLGTAKTPAVHPLTALSKDWLAYVIGTRTEEGAIEVISMALEKKAAEHARMRAALERIAQFDAYEPAGPAAQEAREVLASLAT